MNKIKRNPFSIGEGEYMIYYQTPKVVDGYTISKFVGVCENFCPSGTSVFWDNNKEQMLIVQYSDILQMKPIKIG